MERRSFLKASAALSCTATVVGCKTSSDDASNVKPTPPQPEPPVSEEVMNWSACLVNCGSNCPVKVFTRDGIITRVETDNEGDDEYGNHQVRACARGRSLKQRTYSSDRLKSPMKRVGKRGEGKFVNISWEQAIDEIHEKLVQIQADYGPRSVLMHYASGAYYNVHTSGPMGQVLNKYGGKLNTYGSYSWAQQGYVSRLTGFASTSGSYLTTLKDSDLFLSFAYNPSEMRQSGSGEGYDFLLALKNNPNLKTIMVDPRYTDSMLGKEDEWLPIRPGTDAAFMEALAYEMISSGWVDANSKAWLDEKTVGYDFESIEKLKDKLTAGVADGTYSSGSNQALYLPYIKPEDNYKDYILGEGKFQSGGPRTPEWAAKICGISVAQIKSVANDLMAAKAPYIVVGAGVNRQANGEQHMRAGYVLAMLTGKIGQPGVSNGCLPAPSGTITTWQGLHGKANNPQGAYISFYSWEEAIRRGKEMTPRKDGVSYGGWGNNKLDEPLGANIKAIFNFNGNALINQHSDCNGTKATLEDESLCELIVVSDCWMTPSAMFADYILPDSTWLEKNDVVDASYAAGLTSQLTAMSTSMKPMFDTKSMYDIAAMFADKLGWKEGLTKGKTADEWVKKYYEDDATWYNNDRGPAGFRMPETWEEGKKAGVFKHFQTNVRLCPKDNPSAGSRYKTTSGLFEIYSTELAFKSAEYVLDETVPGNTIEPIPMYQACWGGYEDEALAAEYPLQLFGYHTKGRTHSSYHNVPWLREAVEDAVWMNPIDAEERGLKGGDTVHVTSSEGTIEVPVKVTPRIATGTTALGQGAWYKSDLSKKDKHGKAIDVGGCLNTLTRYQPSPLAKGNPQHTNRVQITKA